MKINATMFVLGVFPAGLGISFLIYGYVVPPWTFAVVLLKIIMITLGSGSFLYGIFIMGEAKFRYDYWKRNTKRITERIDLLERLVHERKRDHHR